MQVVNVKELKARLSAYLRQVRSGESFLVTDRSEVVARLGPADAPAVGAPDLTAKLVAIGVRPPLRGPRPSDYSRPGPGAGLSTGEIDQLLADTRRDRVP